MNKEKVYYNSLNKYLYKLFGCKVYKISLNLGVTCPNTEALEQAAAYSVQRAARGTLPLIHLSRLKRSLKAQRL